MEPDKIPSILPSSVNISTLHENLVSNGYKGSLDEFSKNIQDPTARKNLYDNFSANGYKGTYDEFSSNLGIEKKKIFPDNSQSLDIPSQSKKFENISDLGKVPSLSATKDQIQPIQNTAPTLDEIKKSVAGRISMTKTQGQKIKIGQNEYDTPTAQPVKLSEYLQFKGASPTDILSHDIEDRDLSSTDVNLFDTQLKNIQYKYTSPNVNPTDLQLLDTDSPYVKQAKLIGLAAKTNRDATIADKYIGGTIKGIVKGVDEMVVKPIVGLTKLIEDIHGLSTIEGQVKNAVGLPQDHPLTSDIPNFLKTHFKGSIFNDQGQIDVSTPDLPNNIGGQFLAGAATLPGMLLSFAATPEAKVAGIGLKMAANMGLVAFGNSYNTLTDQNKPILEKITDASVEGLKGAKSGLIMEGIMWAGSSKIAQGLTKEQASAAHAKAVLKSIAVNATGFGGLNVVDQFNQTGDVDWHSAIGNALFGGVLGIHGGGNYDPKGPELALIPQRINSALTNYFATPKDVLKTASKYSERVYSLRRKANELRQEVIPDDKVDVTEENGLQNVTINVDPTTLKPTEIEKLTQASTLDNLADAAALDNHFSDPKVAEQAISEINADTSLTSEQKIQQIETIKQSVANHDPINIASEKLVSDIEQLNKELSDIGNSADGDIIKKIKTEAKNKQIKEKEQQITDIINGTPVKTELPIENPQITNPKTEPNGKEIKANAEANNHKKSDVSTQNANEANQKRLLKPTEVAGESPAAIPIETKQSVIDEINSKPLTHAEGIGMGQNEMEGTYISTEKTNRYSKDAKTVTADVKNPYVLKDSSELVDLQNSVLDKAKENYIKDNPESKADIENVKSFDEIPAEYGDFQDYVAKEVTAKLKVDGHDSAYLRETKDSEGMLVVFDKTKVGGIEKTPETTKPSKAKQATGFIMSPIKKIKKALDKYQGRTDEYSTQTYNSIISDAQDGTLNISSIPPIQIWAKTGELLAGHSRVKAFEDLASGKYELHSNFKKSDFEHIATQVVEAKTFEDARTIAQESNKGAVQTELENARYVKESLLPAMKGKTQKQINDKLESLYGNNKNRVKSFAFLNIEGDTWEALRQFEKTQNAGSGDKLKDIATWIGEERRKNPLLTDVHENEIFKFLYKDGGYKDMTQTEFVQRMGALTKPKSGIFDPSKPLNLARIREKNIGEKEYDDKLQSLNTKLQELSAERDALKDRISNKSNPDYIKPDDPFFPYEETIKLANEKLAEIDRQMARVEIDKKEAGRGKRDAIERGQAQVSIFDVLREQINNNEITNETARKFEQRTTDEITKSEPIIKDIESKAESTNETELNEVITKADELIGENKFDKARKTIEDLRELTKAFIEGKIGVNTPKDVTKNGISTDEIIDGLFDLAKKTIDVIQGAEEKAKALKLWIENTKGDIREQLKLLGMNVDDILKSVEDKFKEDEKTSGIKKALVREETLQSTDWEKISDTEMHKRGKDLIDSGKVDPQKIITEIIVTPRALQPEEVVALIAHKVGIDTRFDDVYKRLAEDPTNNSVKAEAKALETELIEYEQMSLITAQQQSLAFRLRKGLLNREYDLVSQLNKIRANNNGILPKETEKLFKETYDKLKEVNLQLKELEDKLKESEAKLAEKNIIEENQREDKTSISDKGKKLAAEIRKGKLNRPGVFSMATPGSLIWDGAIESVARAVELGSSLAEAVSKELKKIKNTDWYKSHAKQKEIETEFLNHFKIKEAKPSIEKGKIIIPNAVLKRLISEGKTTIEEWTTEIHKELNNPNITETQVRDAITGYGKTVNLTKDQVELEILKQKNIGRLLSALEDVQIKKQNPKKTGAERRTLDERERQLKKQVTELMKELPQTDEDIQNKWKSLLGKRKAQLENDIESLDRQIESRKRDIKQKKSVAYDEETISLTAIRDEKKKILDEIDPVERKGMSDEELVNRTITGLNSKIAQLESDIKEGKLEKAVRSVRKVPETQEIIEKKAQLEVLKETINELRKEAGILEKEALAKLKVTATKKITDLRTRINTKNFAKGRYNKEGRFIPFVKTTKPLDAELRKLNGEKTRLQETFEKEQFRFELQNRSKGEKIKSILLEAWALPRAFIAGVDLSATLIQGLIRTVTRPLQARKAGIEMLKQIGSEERYLRFMAEFKTTDLYAQIRASGGYLSEQSFKFTAREEMFQSGWFNHIWDAMINQTVGRIGEKSSTLGKNLNPYKAGQRAFESYINMMRIQAYEEYFGLMERDGMTIENNMKDFQAFSSMINNFTMRGKLFGSLDRSADVLTLVMFSPRKVAANLNVLNPRFYYKMYQRSPMAAKKAMINMAQFVGVMGSVFALANMIGSASGQDNTVELDPRSTRFLKIKVNGKYVDLLAGHSQILIVLSRIAFSMFGLPAYKQSPGIIKVLGADRNTPTTKDIAQRFVEGKASPQAGMVMRWLDRRLKGGTWVDPFGGELSLKSELMRNTVPIWMQGMDDIYKSGDPLANHGLMILSVFGSNLAVDKTLENREKKLINEIQNPPKRISVEENTNETISTMGEDLKTYYQSDKINGKNIDDMKIGELRTETIKMSLDERKQYLDLRNQYRPK